MSLTVTDIFNMANQSRVALFESSNMLLVRSVILPRYNEVVLAYSKRLNADNFGLGDLFFK